MNNLQKQFNNPFEATNLLKATGYQNLTSNSLTDDCECEDDLQVKGCLGFLGLVFVAVVLICLFIYKLIW